MKFYMSRLNKLIIEQLILFLFFLYYIKYIMSAMLKSVWDAVFMAVVSLIIFMLLVKYLEIRENVDPSNFKFNTVEVMFLVSVVLGSFADDVVKNLLTKLM